MEMPAGLVRDRVVHRVDTRGAAAGADDAPIACPDRVGDRGCGPVGIGVRCRASSVVADRAPRLHRTRRRAAGRAGTGAGVGDRRDPPRQTQMGVLHRNAAVGAGGSVGHRVRRSGRRAGAVWAAHRPHRRRRDRMAAGTNTGVPGGGRLRGDRPGRGVRLGAAHRGVVAERNDRG
jgi:hypothetical protein